MSLAAAIVAALAAAADESLPEPGDAAAIVQLEDGVLVFQHHPHTLAKRRISPGSVMKIVTAYAVAEAGLEDETYDCHGAWKGSGGRERPCWYRPGHGKMKLRTALAASCNVWFYEQSSKLEPERLRSAFRQFGIGEAWLGDRGATVDTIPPLTADILPDVALGDHSSLQVTPLSLLRMVSVVATRGARVTPVEQGPPVIDHPAIDAHILDRIALGMEEAARTGTLVDVFPSGEVAAKSGTAKRLGERGTRAIVVGYFPLKSPRWAFVVVKDRGRGAKDAGPPAARLIRALLK